MKNQLSIRNCGYKTNNSYHAEILHGDTKVGICRINATGGVPFDPGLDFVWDYENHQPLLATLNDRFSSDHWELEEEILLLMRKGKITINQGRRP